MKNKPYGKLLAIFEKNSSGSKYGLMDRTLLIYETKKGLRGDLWNSGFKGWMGGSNQPIASAHFYYKDNDATIYRVREYFNFTGDNVHEEKVNE